MSEHGRRGDGRVSVRTVSHEEMRLRAEPYAEPAEAVKARIEDIDARLASENLTRQQRTLLEVERRVAHLTTPEQRREARMEARRAVHQTNGIQPMKPNRARVAQVKAHPLYSKALNWLGNRKLPRSIEDIAAKIEEMERLNPPEQR